MFRRSSLAVPVLAAALLTSGVAATPASAATWAQQQAAAQKQAKAAWDAAMLKLKLQLQGTVKENTSPTASPYVAKGFTVEIPIGTLGTQIAGLGLNATGNAAAVAIGSLVGVTGDLYFVDVVKGQFTKVPIGVSLPFNGANSISLDGKRVVFNSGIGIFSKPYAFVRGAPNPVQLSTKNSLQPSISSDGNTYALATEGGLLGKDTIAIGDPKLGIPLTIETAPSSSVQFGRPQVSADGRYIGWIVQKGTVTEFHKYDQKTMLTTITDLATRGVPAGGGNVLTDWSYDSRRLLLARTTGSTRVLYQVDLIGTSRFVATIPAAVEGESDPTFRYDAASVALATPTPTDVSDTNNATDLAWVNAAGTSYQRQSIDASNKQLVNGIGLTLLGQRVPRFASSDSAVAALWVNQAPTGGGETLFVRTTLPVPRTPAPTTPAPTTP